MKRRDLIRGGVLAGAVGLLPAGLTAANIHRAAPRSARARNLIFFAYDGMTYEDVALAQWYARRSLGRPLVLQQLLQRGSSGVVETFSLTSVVTDSSAASCAWSTGRKIVNGMVNMFPDGVTLTPIHEIARAHGRATGLVTTTRITHATPAGWVAKVPDREMEDTIAEQYLAFAPDVLLGGGARHFLPGRRADGRDMFAAFRNAGYDVLRTAADLERSNASRVLGVFSDDHMPFELDRVRQHAGGPSLAEMTRKGLALLDGADGGFALQVEAGRIDHANHKNDAAATLHDMMAADEALAVVMQFVDENPDTLLLVASDHGTGLGGVYGVGRFYRGASAALARIEAHDATFDHILARLGEAPGAADVRAVVHEHTGISLSDEQIAVLRQSIESNARAGIYMAFNDQPFNSLGHVLYGGAGGRHPERVNINYVTGQHVAGPVIVAAYGRGAEALDARFVDNTELFRWMLSALGAEHENPRMDEAAALEAMAAGAYVPAREPLLAHA